MAGLSTYLDLYLKLKTHGDLKDFNFLHQVIVSKIPYEVSKEDLDIISEFCRNFTKRLSSKWKNAGRSEKTFLNRVKNRDWLESSILWPTCDTIDLKDVMECGGPSEIYPCTISSISTMEVGTSMETKTTIDATTSTNVATRKPFEDLSNKQKKRRSGSILDAHTEEELLFIFISKLKENGKLALAKIIKKLYESPEHEAEVTKIIFAEQKPIILSEDKSLSLCTSLSLSKWKYLTLRSFLKEEELAAALPSYAKLLAAKKRCYPPEESMEITERGARIRLQELLDHTVKRILLDLGPLTNISNESLKMVWKWGLDGSSSQSNYKQRWTRDASEYNESSVVMTSIVPLRLIDANKLIIWENPAPCSTYYCRPVKFTFASETADFIRAEESDMNQEIAELVPTRCDNVEIGHELHMTMIDGKVVTSLADVRSHSTCPICLATPSQMNKLDILAQKPPREDIYKYGLSPLHMKIRCMECLLHISYHMDFQRWSARTSEQKALKQAKKDFTQEEYREQTGLLIDIVKQVFTFVQLSFGTTNDGNTARRFFDDYERTSRITGIDINLVFRFYIILQAISSGKKINIEAFRVYCRETAEMYVRLYPWYYMPTSVHKLLMHGADICNHFSVLPIGILSEEASEARNKDFRNVREKHTRKIGRIQTNADILHGLLISSDPHISHIRPKYIKAAKHQLHSEAVQLLQMDAAADYIEEEETVDLESENISDPLL